MAVAGLAMHELWISFRLLLVVAAILLASLPAALLPSTLAPGLAGAPLDAFTWYAVALAGALLLAAVVAAATLARERRRGTAGWMVGRAVPRATVLLGWFAAFGIIVAAALLPSAIVGWLSLENALPPTGPAPFAAALAGALAAGLAAMALGLLAGSVLQPAAAALATLLVAGPPLLGAATGQWGWAAQPAGGLEVLAGLATARQPIADALLGSGTALAICAALLLAAMAAFERAEL